MGKVYEQINDKLAAWIGEQHLFFVSTAPLSEDGLVNCSPKGMNTFRILDAHTVAYLDLTGSGVETIAHLRENGRIVVMFCAFEGAPKIVRLHGRGEVLAPGDNDFVALRPHFSNYPGARAIIRIDVQRISDSCGYAVPRYAYQEERDTLVRWAEQKGSDGLVRYRAEKNGYSVDGLPGLG